MRSRQTLSESVTNEKVLGQSYRPPGVRNMENSIFYLTFTLSLGIIKMCFILL